ncbi:Crp/Fnr family transcriptional regulator [Trichocoleus sp. FACHB-591]|uniref:Crp/Fnr family transcriptional regulator n=1 Tax=Trichocoleus sp. FACHB-591 TaxID=2692872 RepID=UPI001688FF87|nr:Crp/Fnr family transcriptional regulator [Trichocoleus sp. FACHB-591]MBD2097870.1 Crp/Fnr family transcriptional regulator [Trichocoleus sp. FACHB-591]
MDSTSTRLPKGQQIQNRLLAKLPSEELELLRPHLEEVELTHGQPLILPYEPIPYVYFPTTALASLVTVLEDGATVESGSVGCEGVVGLPVFLDAGITPMQNMVQIPGQGIRVRSDIAKAAFDRRGDFYSLIHRYIHTLLVVASQSAACNRHHAIKMRLSRWLLMSSDGVGSEELALTQEFLATMLGVRRSGVTEAALQLQQEQLISYGRGKIRILDRKRLEASSCECYQMVKNEFARLLSLASDRSR